MESQKNHTYITTSGTQIQIKYVPVDATAVHTIGDILLSNRGLKADDTLFFAPTYDALHDPYLLPDMHVAVARILHARDIGERVVVFGDYDVDGVSSTAMLVRYMTEIGIQVSYRLPHRVHDGYGLKEYFFDELAEKNVKLVITVDCGTRDILPIRYAKSLGIDVIVTDHHAVPAEVPTEVVGIVNPKRTDSIYPFSSLAGAGVAFKLLHAICIEISRNTSKDIQKTLSRYIEFAALGTVSDCMPLVGENRTIVTLGLQAMAQSTSSGLRQFLAEKDDIVGNADIIGFQIGPRINAAGRMDTPVKALQWLLAGDVRAGELFQEIEHLNEERKEATISYLEDALHTADPADGILFYDSPTIEHGVIGLVAGRLTEQYNIPSICLRDEGDTLVASCRSPAWCDLIGLLDICKSYFVRYGGHRQAAGFTIAKSQYIPFKDKIREVFATVHTMTDLPKKVLYVEASISPTDISLPTLDILDTFRPYGIGNPPPLFLLEDVTISRCEFLGKGEDHICIYLVENPGVKYVMWRWQETLCTGSVQLPYTAGDILSVVVSLERNIWKGKTSISGVIKEVVR